MRTPCENAAYALVHATRDSARDIAERVGIKQQVLTNKVSPTCDRNHLMLAEAVAIQRASGDHRILHAMAEELGEVCLRLPSVEDADLMQETLRTMQAVGKLMGETESAIADGQVTPNELVTIERAMLELMAHVSAMHGRLAKMAER